MNYKNDFMRIVIDSFEGKGTYDRIIAKMVKEIKNGKKYSLLTPYGKKLLRNNNASRH